MRHLVILYFFLFLVFITCAQIPVHEEPLHHPVLTKPEARILDVIANPNDTSQIHQHNSNYCYVTLNGGKIWVQNAGELGRTVELPTGFIGGYYENPHQPLVHRFANRSGDLIRLIAIENLSLSGNPFDTIVHFRPDEEAVVDNTYFLVTKIPLGPNERLDIQFSYSSVIVNLDKKPLQSIAKKRVADLTTWIWLDANKKISLFNPLSYDAWIVLVQIKNEG